MLSHKVKRIPYYLVCAVLWFALLTMVHRGVFSVVSAREAERVSDFINAKNAENEARAFEIIEARRLSE
jgi:hypothetical protein